MPDGTLFEVVRQLPRHSVCLLAGACTSLRFRAQTTAVWLSWPHASCSLAAQEWQGVIHNWHIMEDFERTELLYGGIPPTWRPQMWLFLTDALRLKQHLDTGAPITQPTANKTTPAVDLIEGHGYWESLLQEDPGAKLREAQTCIEKDAPRLTFGTSFSMGQPSAKEKAIARCQAFRRVSLAVCKHLNSDVYVSTNGPMWAKLSTASGFPEEIAFYMILASAARFPPTSHLPGAATYDQDPLITALDTTIQHNLPELYEKLQMSADAILYSQMYMWIACKFTHFFVCPALTARVWDVLFWEGYGVLFKVAVAILAVLEDRLLSRRYHLIDSADIVSSHLAVWDEIVTQSPVLQPPGQPVDPTVEDLDRIMTRAATVVLSDQAAQGVALHSAGDPLLWGTQEDSLRCAQHNPGR